MYTNYRYKIKKYKKYNVYKYNIYNKKNIIKKYNINII